MSKCFESTSALRGRTALRLVVTKAGSDCCGLSLKITEEEEEAAVCVAAAKEISVNAAAAAVSSEFDGVLALKRRTSISTAGFAC